MKNIGTATKKYSIAPYIFRTFKIEIEESYISAIKQGVIAGLIGVLCVLGTVILWLS